MPYTQVTLAQLRTDLRALTETSPYWTDTEATSAINEALRTWNLMTGQFKTIMISTTVADAHWYTVPSTSVPALRMLYPIRVIFQSYPLDITTIFDLDYGKAGWEGQTTADGDGVPTRPAMWAPAGFNRFVMWPADAVGGSDMTIEGVAWAPQLVDPTDTVDLGREDHDALLDYALNYLAFKEGGGRFAATYDNYRNFLKAAGNRNSRLTAATFYKEALIGRDFAREQKPMNAPVQPIGAR